MARAKVIQRNDGDATDALYARFKDPNGDYFTWLNVLKAFEASEC